jgi:hypothetical protein
MHDGVFHNPSCSRAFCFPIFCNLLGWQCRAPFVSKLEHGSESCRKGVFRERKGGKPTRAKERERERERSNRQCRSLPARLQQRRDAQTALSLEEKLRHSPPLQYPHTQTLIYFHNFTKLINSYYLHFLSEKQLFFCLHFFDEFFFWG